MHSERALGGSEPLLDDDCETARYILADLVGLGPLRQFVGDPNFGKCRSTRPTRSMSRVAPMRTHIASPHQGQVRDLVERMLQSTGRRVGQRSPFVNASLTDVISVANCASSGWIRQASQGSLPLGPGTTVGVEGRS
jgi:pilus assembly protein CpaF